MTHKQMFSCNVSAYRPSWSMCEISQYREHCLFTVTCGMVWCNHSDVSHSFGGIRVHGGPQMVYNQLYRLCTVMFISEGDEIPRILIHLLLHIVCRHQLQLCTWSLTMTTMFAWECALLLKCATAGKSSGFWLVHEIIAVTIYPAV